MVSFAIKNGGSSHGFSEQRLPEAIARIPSGNRLHNYGQSPFSMGKSSTINSNFPVRYVSHYQRVS